MSHQSTPELLVLHAVRTIGFASLDGIALHAHVDRDTASNVLHDAEAAGWVQHLAFADLDGWSLTDAGKAENERQLSAERAIADPKNTIPEAYRQFLPLNARLVQAVTEWQIRPTANDPYAPNDHTDAAWDDRLIEELAALGAALLPLTNRLASALARFDHYSQRFDAALDKAVNGQHDWIDKTNIDSCHRVWFQLHEDLIAPLGIDRGAETAI